MKARAGALTSKDRVVQRRKDQRRRRGRAGGDGRPRYHRASSLRKLGPGRASHTSLCTDYSAPGLDCCRLAQSRIAALDGWIVVMVSRNRGARRLPSCHGRQVDCSPRRCGRDRRSRRGELSFPLPSARSDARVAFKRSSTPTRTRRRTYIHPCRASARGRRSRTC